jgi:hypothetical protein
VDTPLNALDADRDQFQAELNLAQIRRTNFSRLSSATKLSAAGGNRGVL